MPDEREALGLLALLLLTDARRSARLAPDGALISLREQDRTRWDGEAIADGLAVVDRAVRLGPGPYVIQAAIAALHAQAPDFASTDWAQIAGLYAELERHDRSPVVTVNRAVAVSHAEDAAAGLAVLDGIADDRRLDRYGPLAAARADLLRRTGDIEGADAAYARAIELSENPAERAALERQRREAESVTEAASAITRSAPRTSVCACS